MSLTTRVGLLAGASALALTGVSVADNSTEATDQEARIAELEAQVARLSGDNWLTEERAEEVRALVQDVLADADTRASLLQSGMSAGYDNGFVIGSPDGAFSLKMNGVLQTRYVINSQNGADNGNTDDELRGGFEVTRSRLIFSGNVAGPEWGYYVNANFSNADGSFDLQDAVISYDAGNGWSMLMGQMKVPLVREWLVDSANQLAVERSSVAYYYGGGRTQGFALDFRGDNFHIIGAISNGVDADAADYFAASRPWSAEDTEYSLTGRAELMLGGNWDQFEDLTSPRGSESGTLLGFGVHWQNGEYGTTAPNDNEVQILMLTGDVSMEFDGWNLFGSINYANIDPNAGDNYSPWGAVIQGGFYFTEKWEGFARYEYNSWDDFGVEGFSSDDLNLVTVGVNAYYNSNVKMTADFGYSFNAVDVSAGSQTGLRTDANREEDGQMVLRAQLQLTF